jgi:hypothetical protein
MRSRSILRATLAAVVALLLLAPPAMADTCCANLPVELDPIPRCQGTRSGSSGWSAAARTTGVHCP